MKLQPEPKWEILLIQRLYTGESSFQINLKLTPRELVHLVGLDESLSLVEAYKLTSQRIPPFTNVECEFLKTYLGTFA